METLKRRLIAAALGLLTPSLANAESAPPAPATDTPPPPEPSIEHRLAAIEKQQREEPKLTKEDATRLSWLRRFKLTGFVQPQLLVQMFNAAASPNATANGLPKGIEANDALAKADGTTTNGTFFRLRRARLKTEFMPTDFARLVVELDPAPVGGPSAGVGTMARQVEAIGIVHWTPGFVTDFGLGIFKLPFGFEIPESDADRIFVERSWGQQNMMPGEFDLGARATSSLFQEKLKGSVAIVNGVTQGEKTFALLPDLNRAKDVVGRVTYNFGALTPGLSGYYGKGQVVDATNLRTKQFPRWSMNAELAVGLRTLKFEGSSAPATRITGEITRGQNMDRGTKYAFALPSIPNDLSQDVADKDELSTYVRLEQDLTQRITLAARYDYYSPDTSQADNARHTFAFAFAARFTKGLQMVLEFNHAIDHVHKAGAAIPSKEIETVSSVLQARF